MSVSFSVRVGDRAKTVELEPGHAYRVRVAKASGEDDFTVSAELIATPDIIQTGTCSLHREPLYDGSDMCSDCWDEYDSLLYSEPDDGQ